MIARLLYAAVALCVLGTRPEHAATPGAPAAAAVASPPVTPAPPSPGAAAAGIGGAPADFAIPRNSR